MCRAWHTLLFLSLSISLSTLRASLRCGSSAEPSLSISNPGDLDFLLHAAVVGSAAWYHMYLFCMVYCYILNSSLQISLKLFIKSCQIDMYQSPVGVLRKDTVLDFDRADGPMGRCVNHQRELESERCQEVC